MMKKITLKGCLLALAATGFMQVQGQQLQSLGANNLPKQLQAQPGNQSFELTAETKRGIQETGYGRCLSVENEAILQKTDSKRYTDAQFEEFLAPHIAKIKADRLAGKSQMAIYNIPVVIHIVHNGNAVNTNGAAANENISTAQAISQIDVMNEDYRRLASTPGGANSTGVAVDVEINFCLAVTDPSGNPTTGIVRHNITPYTNTATPGTPDDWELRSDVETMKTNTQWDPTKYMNMWSIKPGGQSLQNGGLTGLLGYAQFPSNSGLGGLNTNGGAASTDGVVAGYDAFGTLADNDGSFVLNPTYNLGRTMTHEVGHWLGLRHIWGDGNAYDPTGVNGTVQGSCPVDDYCVDTPNARAANYSCVSNNNCGAGAEQVENYMDYTNDACMDTFTQDQKDRMQAVMAVSPRRMELNASTACSPNAPYIAFANVTSSANEGTDCAFTDYSFAVNIAEAPTGAANIAFNIDGGTAVNTNDYMLVNNSVTFANGSTASQNLTVRVYNDGFVEGNETIELSMSLSGSTDAQLNSSADSIVITLIDDDNTPNASTAIDVYDEDFEDVAAWAIYDRDGDGRFWGTVNGLDGYGDILGRAGYSETDGTILSAPVNSYNPDQYLVSEAFTIPAGATSAMVSYVVGSYSPNGSHAEHYSVYFTTVDPFGAYADIEEFVLENDRTVPAAGTEVRTHDLIAYAGMTGKLAFRHHNSAGANGLLLIDTVNVDAVAGTAVQTAENSGTQDQVALGASGTIYSGDASTGDIMMDIVNGNNQDYGCVSGYVSRGYNAGSPAVMYQTAGTANYVMSKAFSIQAASQQASGTGSVKFYFTEAEIAAWESATGNSRNDLVIIKDANTVSLMPGVPEVITPTIGAFGSNVTLEGNFTSGITGGYVFGTMSALTVSENQFDVFGVYPNPSNGEVTISLSTSNDVNVSLFDIRGRKVYGNLHSNTSDSFTEKVDFSAMASGVYMLEVQSGSKRAIKKVVIQ
jgi:hypothetical protein